jgi:hypothetical protein
MAWARHSRAINLALRERTPHMGARVIEGIQMSECTCDVHLGSRDIKDAHLVRDNILCVTNSYQHDFTSFGLGGRLVQAAFRAILKYSTKSFFSSSVKFRCLNPS